MVQIPQSGDQLHHLWLTCVFILESRKAFEILHDLASAQKEDNDDENVKITAMNVDEDRDPDAVDADVAEQLV